ncbi:MAG: UPF0280 family protein [Paracoccaceae bacterium]|nr:UPF0280 family protein [Paracoccaceae bacterium]
MCKDEAAGAGGGAGGGALAAVLPDGRLHLQHGPIDLIVQAWGPGAAAGYLRARARFAGLLTELAAELPALRAERAVLRGPVARAMAAAVAVHHPAFITPMAAVAGAVADAVLAALAGPRISRAYVNNGGDIALYLTPGESLAAAIAGICTGARLRISHVDPVRGIATSGWRGRSFSFGIADAVTVLAATAADADAAATMIANAVDLPGHFAITRRPACDMQADSDLGARQVTVAVDALTPTEVSHALGRGEAVAQRLFDAGQIAGVALFLHPEIRTLGRLFLPTPTPEPCLG